MAKLPSTDYWAKRAEDRLLSIERQTSIPLDQINRANHRAVMQIRDDIDQIIGRFARNSNLTRAQAIEVMKESISPAERDRIMALCNSVADPTTRARLMSKVNAPAYKARIDRLQAVEVNVQARLAAIAPEQISVVDGFLKQAGRDMYTRTIFDLQLGTGLDFSFAGVSEKQLRRVLSEKWSGEHFSTRVWQNTDIVAQRVTDVLRQNMMTGRSWRRSLREVEDQALISSNYAASRLLRTETNYVSNQMEAVAYQEAGLDEYRFVATLDGRTSPMCQEKDGKRFKLKDKKVGVNYPPLHPHCRSTTIAVIDGFDVGKLKRRARDPDTGETELVPAGTTYEDWRKAHKSSGIVASLATSPTSNKVMTLAVNATNNFYRGVNNAYAEALDHGRKTGNECLTWVDKDGKQAFPPLYGTNNQVNFTQQLIDFLNNAPNDNLVSIHNHPQSSSFSHADLGIMSLFPSIKQMRVAGHNGYKYYMSIGSGKRPTQNDIRLIYDQEVAARHPKYQAKVNGGMSSYDAWLEHSHEAVKAVAKHFGWSYRRIRK